MTKDRKAAGTAKGARKPVEARGEAGTIKGAGEALALADGAFHGVPRPLQGQREEALTAGEEAFVRKLVETGDVEAAWKHGSEVERASWENTPTVGQHSQQGGELVLPPAPVLLARSSVSFAVDALIREKLSTETKARAFAKLNKLIDAPNDNVALKTVQTILRLNGMENGDAAGSKALASMTRDELASFIQRADAAIAAAGMGPAINVTPAA